MADILVKVVLQKERIEGRCLTAHPLPSLDYSAVTKSRRR